MNPIGNPQSPIGNRDSLVSSESPWPGLSSFTEDSREFFFGREKETDELSRLVRRQTLTVLFGQSGLGKSSLLHAGLFPILRETDHLPLYLRLDHSPVSPAPAEQVKAALTAAFAAVKAEAPAFRPDETLWEYFHRKDVDIWSAKNRLLTPVLAFDQFEEIFTLGRADETCRERSRVFLAELACLVENRAPAAVQERLDRGELDPASFNFQKPSCQVILSLREDFLPDLEGLKQSMPALVHNRLRLKRLSGTQALEIVTKPAPHLLAEGVAEKIVEFVAGARGGSAERLAELDVEPPLLSVICRELNDRRRSLGQEKITADLVSGNRREILTDFYERSVADLPAEVRTFIEDHLLTKSGFRDNLALETSLEFPGVTRPLIDALVARRLLRLEDRLGVQRVELTHDVLADVIRASRDSRQQRVALERERENERLALAAAVRQARRQRFAIAGLVAAVVALLVGAYFGIRAQRSSAAQASQTDLVLGSRFLDDGKLIEGLAYLVRAGRKDHENPLIAPRLLAALGSHRFFLPTEAAIKLPSPALGGAFTADGKWLSFQCEDGAVRVIDTTMWQAARTYDFGGKIQGGGVRGASKNSDVFAVLLEDNSILVCDSATGRPKSAPIQPPGKVNRMYAGPVFGLSPDGRYVGASGPGVVWVWDASTGELAAKLPVNGYYQFFTFSPDSRKIATTLDRVTTIWSIADRAPVGAPIKSEVAVWFTDFSADGLRLLIMNYDGAIVCEAATGVPVRPMIPLDVRGGSDFMLSNDGTKLINSTAGRTVAVLDVMTGQPVYPALPHGSNVRGVQLVGDGKVLFTNCVDGLVRLWDFQTGKLIAEPTHRQSRMVPATAAPDGKSVVLFTPDGTVQRLRVGSPALAPLELPREQRSTAFINMVPGTPARIRWLTMVDAKSVDISSGKETAESFPYPEKITDARREGYGATLGAGDVVLVLTKGGSSRIWTMGEKGLTQNVAFQDPPAKTVSRNSYMISSATKKIAAPLDVGGTPNGQLLGVWDTQTGARLAAIQASGGLAYSTGTTTISPTGDRVSYRSAETGEMKLAEIPSGKVIFSLPLTGKARFSTARYSANGKHILTGDTWGAVQVWNASNGALLRTSQHHRSAVTKFEFSPDFRFYASVAVDGSVQVWDASTDLPVGALLELAGNATRAEFSPDNTRIATPSGSGHARVWDVHTGLAVTDPLGNEGESISVVAFSPDGRFVLAHAGANPTRQITRTWSVPPASGPKTPDWLLTLATIAAGHRLSGEGKLLGAPEELAKIAEVRQALAAAPADDPLAEWGRWLLSEDPNRPIGPGFTLTKAEADKIRDEFMRAERAAANTP